LRQFLLGHKQLVGGGNRSGGLGLSGERADVVVRIDGEGCHVCALFLTACRVAHIHHSGSRHKQGNSAAKCAGNIDVVSMGSLMAEGAIILAPPSRKPKPRGWVWLPEVQRCLRAQTAARRLPAWAIGHALDHYHEQGPAFIPTAQPAHPPAIHLIAQRNGMKEP
jgi:hypothetical protein